MGDRIVIRITDGRETSPELYCHQAGLRAIKAVHDALKESRMDISNILCNTIVKVMCGECSNASYYIHNVGEADGMADWDNWTWTFDISNKTWTTTMPRFEGRTLTMDEADRYVREIRPCLYTDCPCESFDRPKPRDGRDYQDTVYKTREGY